MRNTSAPALNKRAIMAASEEAGPSVATILARRNRLIASVSSLAAFGWCRRRGGGWPLCCGRRAWRQRTGGLLFGAVGQLHRPGSLLAGVDLEEAGAVIAARQAVIGTADGEFF